MTDTYTTLLTDFLAHRSVSTDPAYEQACRETADWLSARFQEHGFDVQQHDGYGNPVIIARYTADPSYETCLIYGHYDVQPAAYEDGWASDPFTLTEQNGRLYGRGVVDNKGQVMVHIATIFDLIAAGTLGYNVVFVIEGNEETGSPEFGTFLRNHADALRADFALISDGEVVQGAPVIELGFRGTFSCRVSVQTAASDLHSGLFGSTVPNAIHVLSDFVASLHDTEGRVTIPEFYRDVRTPDPAVQERHGAIADTEAFRQLADARYVQTEDGNDVYTQTGLRPALEATGIQGGYTGDGFKNIVPAHASVDCNVRLVADQDPAHIAARFEEYARQQLETHGEVSVSVGEQVPATAVSTDNPYVMVAQQMLAHAYGSEPVFKFCGGTLPIAYYIDQTLGIPQIFVPLANEDCQMHGVNENFERQQLERSLNFSRRFFSQTQ